MKVSDERNIVITGANRGIGLAMVKKFAENGCNVWACARKENVEFEAEINKLADQFGVWIKPIYFDLTDEEAIKAGVMSIHKEKKPIHTLINNAGVYHNRLFQMHTMKEIKELYETNVFALMYITQLIMKKMTMQKYGNIINVASIAGITPHMGAVCYGSTKAAVISFTESLAIEAGQFGNIRVNAIAPGHTETDMIVSQLSDTDKKNLIESCILKRLAKASEIASVAYFLSSDEASFINGSVIRVDGGLSNGN